MWPFVTLNDLPEQLFYFEIITDFSRYNFERLTLNLRDFNKEKMVLKLLGLIKFKNRYDLDLTEYAE